MPSEKERTNITGMKQWVAQIVHNLATGPSEPL